MLIILFDTKTKLILLLIRVGKKSTTVNPIYTINTIIRLPRASAWVSWPRWTGPLTQPSRSSSVSTSWVRPGSRPHLASPCRPLHASGRSTLRASGLRLGTWSLKHPRDIYWRSLLGLTCGISPGWCLLGRWCSQTLPDDLQTYLLPT